MVRDTVFVVPLEDIVDADAFERLIERHRPEIQLHCYRMLGSVHDAEDATQDALLRAWRGRHGFEGRSSFRGWLYRIATNASLRVLERRANARRVLPNAQGQPYTFEPLGSPDAHSAWIEPYPIDPIDLIADPGPGPAARYEAREAVELSFVAAIQALPPRQRAILLLRDVLGFSTAESAAILEASIASINSALQRARATLHGRRAGGLHNRQLVPDAMQRQVLESYVRAWEAADIDGLVQLLADDATWTMPPWSQWYVGPTAIADFLRWVWRPDRDVQSRLVPTAANGQPAFGYYRSTAGRSIWQPFAIQVLTLRSDRIAAIANFVDAGLFSTFRLPESFTGSSTAGAHTRARAPRNASARRVTVVPHR